jgi:hypothetical protein
VTVPASTPLEPAELLEAAAALADVHRWAAVAWRHVAAPGITREALLADFGDITARLAQAREFIEKYSGSEIPDGESR